MAQPTPEPQMPSAIVLGGGTAGFLTALAIKARFPNVPVRVIRSKEIGIIGVGEGTTVAVVAHLHSKAGLGLDVGEFYRTVNPIWKLGIRYLWGPRGSFNYAFGPQFAEQLPLPRPIAYYLREDLDLINRSAALMTRNKAFARSGQSLLPLVTRDHAYHLENHAFVAYLETQALRRGVVIVEDKVTRVELSDRGVERLQLESGRSESGLMFFDCSGFAGELLGKALKEPFVSYKKTLFCDRAVVGGWERGPNEPIQPYTVAQTMEAGWSWRIDHEHHINRGYVYSSSFITDDQAELEFRRCNPKVSATRIVKFRSGRFERFWVKNVVAIGNASGFVEPMEATAIAAICDQTMAVVTPLRNTGQVTPSIQHIANRRNAAYWDAIPRFLASHYKFNTMMDTPFWRAIWADCDLYGGEEYLEYYRQNGPDISFGDSLQDPHDQFKYVSHLVMYLGQNVPHANPYRSGPQEREAMNQWRAGRIAEATDGFTAEEALAIVRNPDWGWRPGFYDL
jgi:tryptophan halogenase